MQDFILTHFLVWLVRIGISPGHLNEFSAEDVLHLDAGPGVVDVQLGWVKGWRRLLRVELCGEDGVLFRLNAWHKFSAIGHITHRVDVPEVCKSFVLDEGLWSNTKVVTVPSEVVMRQLKCFSSRSPNRLYILVCSGCLTKWIGMLTLCSLKDSREEFPLSAVYTTRFSYPRHVPQRG